MRRVFQFGIRPPTVNAARIRAQLRAAHEYRNDLVAIERGRRWALRAVDDTPNVREATAAVVVAPKSERAAALTALREARKAARAEAPEVLAQIAEREHALLLAARALTPCFWCTYLDIEAAHRQSRAAPLYGDDAVSPNDPRFARGPRLGREAFGGTGEARESWWLGEGQIGVQIQGGAPTSEVLAGEGTQCRLIMRDGPYGTLWLRVGSDGRDPIWGQWPIKVHRRVPDSARWKWVRVSVRHVGTREVWTCEVTVDDAAPAPRTLDTDLTGAITVSWAWDALDDGRVRVASWANDVGESGDVILPVSVVSGLRKPDGIRSVRDNRLNVLRPALANALRFSIDGLPPWLAGALEGIPYWKAPERFVGLVHRWRRERFDGAREAYTILDAWWEREGHLHDYEANARREAHRERREIYRVLAAEWSRRYRTVLLSNHDLSREAKWGDESALRFLAAPYELRSCLCNAFGLDAIQAKWKDNPDERETRSWCERTRDAWIAAGARDEGRFSKRKESTGNAWAARKAKAAEKRAAEATAREAAGRCAK